MPLGKGSVRDEEISEFSTDSAIDTNLEGNNWIFIVLGVIWAKGKSGQIADLVLLSRSQIIGTFDSKYGCMRRNSAFVESWLEKFGCK